MILTRDIKTEDTEKNLISNDSTLHGEISKAEFTLTPRNNKKKLTIVFLCTKK